MAAIPLSTVAVPRVHDHGGSAPHPFGSEDCAGGNHLRPRNPTLPGTWWGPQYVLAAFAPRPESAGVGGDLGNLPANPNNHGRGNRDGDSPSGTHPSIQSVCETSTRATQGRKVRRIGNHVTHPEDQGCSAEKCPTPRRADHRNAIRSNAPIHVHGLLSTCLHE